MFKQIIGNHLKGTQTYRLNKNKEQNIKGTFVCIFNRPGVAGAVPQSPSSLTDSVSP